MNILPSYFRYWGKADPKYPAEPKWHPLVYHCLDVAAVASGLLDQRPVLLDILERSTGIPRKHLRCWIVFLHAIHDIGKFGDGFQWKQPNLAEMQQERKSSAPEGERHDTMGYEVAAEYLLGWLGKDVRDADLPFLVQPWFASVTGHHGRPPANLGDRRFAVLRSGFPKDVLPHMRAFAESTSQLLLPNGWPLPEPQAGLEERFWQASWLLAGLAVASDWLGSNTRWFPYCYPDLDLARYWDQVALPQAKQAVSDSGLVPPAIAPFAGMANLFPRIAQPTPLQDWASSIAIAEDAQIFVLEDLTGAGKTEASLTLAARLMEAGRGQGVYLALPTMATADAMFDRVRSGDVWRRFFADDKAQLSLAHSADRLKLRLEEANRRDAAYGKSEELTASIHCSAWLSDSRKKALLADFGVGTLDQALLAVLPIRHQSLRLLGLATKVLIVDEVHACDSYMGELLARLLFFHVRLGGSAILLSATLPFLQRKRYLNAFAEGAGLSCTSATSKGYPLATHFSSHGTIEDPLPARIEGIRTVTVECIQDEAAVLQKLSEAVQAGRCIVWVRNTVVDAVEAWQNWNVGHAAHPATLFHARFAIVDRIRIGKSIESDFGPQSNHATRTGRLVIATQVIEQSLDVDFDDMVTDIAPIDLIIQRAGRLQRHSRDAFGNRIAHGQDGRGGARVAVLMPAPIESADENWLSPPLKKTGMVYPDHGKLWLTARWLSKHQGFALHDQARDMIESVYDEKAFGLLPQALADISDRADGACRAAKGVARSRLLEYDMGYNPASLVWQDEGEAPTRLGEATTRVRLVRKTESGLIPWADTHTGMEWQLSELTVPRRLIADSSDCDVALIDAARPTMSDEGRYCVMVVLNPEGPALWRGLARNAYGDVTVRYSPLTGLTIVKGAEDESDL